MKTVVITTLLALSLLSGIAGSANAGYYDSYPKWAQEAFEAPGEHR